MAPKIVWIWKGPLNVVRRNSQVSGRVVTGMQTEINISGRRSRDGRHCCQTCTGTCWQWCMLLWAVLPFSPNIRLFKLCVFEGGWHVRPHYGVVLFLFSSDVENVQFFWLQVYKRTAAGYFVLEIKVELNHKCLTYSCKPFFVLIRTFFSKQYESNILQKINN